MLNIVKHCLTLLNHVDDMSAPMVGQAAQKLLILETPDFGHAVQAQGQQLPSVGVYHPANHLIHWRRQTKQEMQVLVVPSCHVFVVQGGKKAPATTVLGPT